MEMELAYIVNREKHALQRRVLLRCDTIELRLVIEYSANGLNVGIQSVCGVYPSEGSANAFCQVRSHVTCSDEQHNRPGVEDAGVVIKERRR